MVQPCVPRRGFKPLAQHAFRIRVASELAVEVGEIGGCRAVGRAQTKRRLKLGFSLCRLATPCMQIAERRPRLGPVRVQSCAAMNSCVARSSLSRSARDSRSLGMPASSEAARMRTPRIGSVRAARRTARADPAARHRACRARRCAPSGLDPEALFAPGRHSPERHTGRARQARPHGRRTERWRPRRPRRAAPPRQAHRARPHGRLRRRFAGPSAQARTSPRSLRPPTRQACPCGSRCRRCSSEACRTDRVVERGSCDRAACRPP